MKTTGKLIIFVITFLALAVSAYAQSPREELQQMVEQLQQTPSDNALREKIITLVATLKPSPALPDTAVAFGGRARFAFQHAKPDAEGDYLAAAQEYEKAVAAAPWVLNFYSDLCLSYEKAGKFEDAKRNCGFYLIGLTDPAEITNVKERIAGLEFGIEKANSPEARAAKEKEAEQRFIASLEGAKYVCPEFRRDQDVTRVEIDIINGKIDGANVITWINPKLTPGVDYSSNAFVGFKGLWFEKIPLQGRVNVKRTKYDEMRVEIYDDRLVYVQRVNDTVYPAQTCLRTK